MYVVNDFYWFSIEKWKAFVNNVCLYLKGGKKNGKHFLL